MPTAAERVLRGDSRLPISLANDDIDALIEALQSHYLEDTSKPCPVRTIALYGDLDEDDDWQIFMKTAPLMEVLGKLKSVVRLEVHNVLPPSIEEGICLDLEEFTELLGNLGDQLEALELASLTLQTLCLTADIEGHLERFCTAIRNLRCLRRLTLTGTFAISYYKFDGTSPGGHMYALDEVVEAISDLPMLDLEKSTQSNRRGGARVPLGKKERYVRLTPDELKQPRHSERFARYDDPTRRRHNSLRTGMPPQERRRQQQQQDFSQGTRSTYFKPGQYGGI